MQTSQPLKLGRLPYVICRFQVFMHAPALPITPPGYLYVLAFLARIYSYIGGGDHTYALLQIMVKLPGVVFDLIDAVLGYLLVRRFMNESRALWAAACIALNPSLIFISSFWGQVDSVAAAFVLVALLGVDAGMRKSLPIFVAIPLSWTSLAVSVLIKPPALLLALLLFLWPIALLKRDGLRMLGKRYAGMALGIVLALVITYLLSAPFAPMHGPLEVANWLIERYQFGSGVYPYNTINAFNLYSITQPFWIPDSLHPIAALNMSQAAWGRNIGRYCHRCLRMSLRHVGHSLCGIGSSHADVADVFCARHTYARALHFRCSITAHHHRSH